MSDQKSTAFDSIFSSIGSSESSSDKKDNSKNLKDNRAEKKEKEEAKKEGKRILKSGIKTKAKTFFLSDDIIRMFKYIKFKKDINESEYANLMFERAFEKEFGKDWKKLVS